MICYDVLSWNQDTYHTSSLWHGHVLGMLTRIQVVSSRYSWSLKQTGGHPIWIDPRTNMFQISIFVLYGSPQKDRTDSIYHVFSWILTNSIYFFVFPCFLCETDFQFHFEDSMTNWPSCLGWHVPGKGRTTRRRTDCRRWRFSMG